MRAEGMVSLSHFLRLWFVLPRLMPSCAEVSVSAIEQYSLDNDSWSGNSSLPYSPSDDHTVPSAAANPTAQETLADKKLAVTALPHAEVPATEFYKHISADITEPRRMRALLGWCGTRLLPAKPHPPTQSTPAAMLEFQAQQAGAYMRGTVSIAVLTSV